MKLTESRLRQIIREELTETTRDAQAKVNRLRAKPGINRNIRKELGQVRPLSKDSAELNRVKFEHDLARDHGHEGVARVRAMAQKLGRNFAAAMRVSDGVQLTIVGPDGDLEVLSSAGRYDEDLDAFGEELKAALRQYGVGFVIRPGVTWDIVVPREAYIRKYVEGLPE